MPQSSKQLKVFLCHSSNDKTAVREFYDKLIFEGWIDPWLDAEKLIPGQDWGYEIEKAVDEADIILVFLTKNSVNKEGYVQRELRIVLDHADYKPEGTLFVIPIRLEECEPPRRLRSWHYADYFPVPNRPLAYKKLIVSLKMRANALEIPTTNPHTDKEKLIPTTDDISQSITKNPDENKQIMLEYATLSREGRYGIPTADQILFNRFYTIGYSYTLRQAKWALETVDANKGYVKSPDIFRPDLRIPKEFRADQANFEGSGFVRGYLVASENELEPNRANYYLLSNMSPMKPAFYKGIWRDLASAVRDLDSRKDSFETYVICGPIFNPEVPIKSIDSKVKKGNAIPIPHSFFKSVLTEDSKGKVNMWSFMIPNKATDKSLGDFLTTTKEIEQLSGLMLWERLAGIDIEKEKSKVRTMWA